MIACLGWGSLVWDARTLPIQHYWFEDGPLIKVDFLRHSDDDRITLVLHNSAQPVRSLWAAMTVNTLDEAINALAVREGMTGANPSKNIGRWSRGTANPDCILELEAWAEARGITSVIWTALPAKFGGQNNRCPTLEEVTLHLSRLTGPGRDAAENYIRRAPRQIDTTYRRHIEAKLGWIPISDQRQRT